MAFKYTRIISLTLSLHFGLLSGQVKDTGLIYHISYNGYTPNHDDKTLFWFTQNEIPQTHFIVEHFCWKNWLTKGRVACSGSQGKHKYKLQVLPHSGENIFRVVLVNDSNVKLASSIELHSVLNPAIVPKVSYTDKKSAGEIKFSSETDYEILDATGKVIREGRGSSVPYGRLDEGVYTLNYDSSTTIFRRKK